MFNSAVISEYRKLYCILSRKQSIKIRWIHFNGFFFPLYRVCLLSSIFLEFIIRFLMDRKTHSQMVGTAPIDFRCWPIAHLSTQKMVIDPIVGQYRSNATNMRPLWPFVRSSGGIVRPASFVFITYKSHNYVSAAQTHCADSEVE